MCWLLLFRGGLAAVPRLAVVVRDLLVQQLQALPLSGKVPPDLLAVSPEQLDPLLVAGAGPDQLGIAPHVPHRHPGSAQLGQKRQPVQIAVAEPAPAIAAPVDRIEQANTLIPAQGVLGQAALLGSLTDGPGRHGTEPTS
jgi:hypothetical protein